MELTLFVIVGAVAVASAAMMLISENAVHSALFLILNFACIAFFFLTLHAPFLAMVQITVYAGAIMVLFLFVIMLLGAERVAPEKQPRFRWLTPAATVLALVFLVTTSAAIVQGEIELTKPQVITPHVRVIHALDGIPRIDVYLDDVPVAEDLSFGESTGFEVWDGGRYSVTVFAAGTDVLLYKHEKQVELNSGGALSLAAIGTSANPGLVVAPEDVSRVEDKDTLRIMAINALHDRKAIDVLDVTGSDDKETLIDNLAYGEVSEAKVIEQGTYAVGVYPEDDHQTRLVALEDEDLESNTAVLWIFVDQRQSGNSWDDATVNLKTDARPSFGSPTHVGQLLFSRYVLPFEMVSLVLLVAMIGAIVLTHETLGAPRRRVVRRLANPPAGLEEPITEESGQ
jgi:NADH:ubiquinone oxidoreductase subunit 6 (subunit J)